MWQILKQSNIDFMGQGRVLLPVSLALVALSVAVLVFNGFNLGIEFTGGTELHVKYAETPRVGEIRGQLSAGGFGGAVVTTIGDAEDNEIYIRLATGGEQQGSDPTTAVLNILRGIPAGDQRSTIDLNIDDERTLAGLLAGAPGLSRARAEEIAAELLQWRREGNIFSSFQQLSAFSGLTPEGIDHLEANSEIGPLALRSQSFIGPAVGRELVEKALIAVVGSLIGMLIYIWIRFQLQWGMAAVAALVHDTLITLGLFSLFDQEMSLPVVAAFLTLIGYSVNDTVVVFDRIRENLAAFRSKALADTVNLSINQTLSRTIITSGLTWLVVVCLLLFGGPALRPFSFVLTVGVAVGTYSSIFIAAPLVVLWQAARDRRKTAAEGGVASDEAPARKAKKIRRTKTI
ncbi:MAG TPA: protein translocase subunit SecF [Candidatus Polarisedimenticolaceae bacterium]|nr:protein translocase subunit SecF [Candidatus Polarisedimenticolaceae bacterium]